MLEEEKSIIKSAVNGKAEAFGLLYDHYHAKIYRFVFIKVSQKQEAEDITHQVFLNAFLNIKNYKEKGFPFSSWLYQIARNQVIDYYRTKKKNIPIEDSNPASFVEDTNEESKIDKNRQIAKIKLAILKLKPEYQDVVILRFIEDLTIKETAEIIGKTEGATKLIQHRAINKLKKIFEKQNGHR